jgi:hypothetical protein
MGILSDKKYSIVSLEMGAAPLNRNLQRSKPIAFLAFLNTIAFAIVQPNGT